MHPNHVHISHTGIHGLIIILSLGSEGGLRPPLLVSLRSYGQQGQGIVIHLYEYVRVLGNTRSMNSDTLRIFQGHRLRYNHCSQRTVRKNGHTHRLLATFGTG
jgi:hypothetical protein